MTGGKQSRLTPHYTPRDSRISFKVSVSGILRNGKVIDYPQDLKVGEEDRVRVGITNREHETVSYSLEVKMEGVTHSAISGIVLGHGEEWEREVGFTPVKVGENQKVEFVLSKEEKPYRWLHLWVNVTR